MRFPWLRTAVSAGTGFESTRYLAKWLVLGIAIGIVVGEGITA